MQGIYSIVCIPKNRIYIGQSTHIKKRWYGHMNDLRRGKNHVWNMLTDWLECGEDAFLFSVVKEIQDASRLLAAEIIFIHKAMKDYGIPNVYNVMMNTEYKKSFKANVERKKQIVLLKDELQKTIPIRGLMKEIQEAENNIAALEELAGKTSADVSEALNHWKSKLIELKMRELI